MAMSKVNGLMRTKLGLTLIEVLIALAILSIALTAMIKASSQTILDTLYLQNKMVANWVGMEVINETRAGVIKLPMAPARVEEERDRLGQTWLWRGQLTITPNTHIRAIQVDVFLPQTQQPPLAHLTGYLYVE